MKTKIIERPLAANPCYREVKAWLPERADVESLKVGDLAPCVWGRMHPVTEIFARSVDIHGAPFVCYYVQDSPLGSISASMKAGELIRTLPLTGLYTSAECDTLEQQMRFS